MKRHDTRQAGPRGIQPLTTTLLPGCLILVPSGLAAQWRATMSDLGVDVLGPYPWAEAPSSP